MRTASCLCCAKVFTRYARGHARFCAECAIFQINEAAAAKRMLKSAIRRGDLLPVVGQNCVDCGAPAKHYEHRDYTKPLDVQPVCVSCNARRGPALNSRMRQMPQAAQSGVSDLDPSTNISCARHGTDALSFAPF